jgi:FkbM family methyltransferase
LEIRLDGEAVEIRIDSWYDLVLASEVTRRDSYRLAPDHGARTVVDVGAHIGITALLALRRYPRAHVYCLEPDPASARLLRANLASYTRARILQAALWGSDGRIGWRPDRHGWSSRTREEGDDVTARSLRSLRSELGLARIDVLKLDCEGAEAYVLDESSLAGVGRVVAELHLERPGVPDVPELARRLPDRKVRTLQRHGKRVLVDIR